MRALLTCGFAFRDFLAQRVRPRCAHRFPVGPGDRPRRGAQCSTRAIAHEGLLFRQPGLASAPPHGGVRAVLHGAAGAGAQEPAVRSLFVEVLRENLDRNKC